MSADMYTVRKTQNENSFVQSVNTVSCSTVIISNADVDVAQQQNAMFKLELKIKLNYRLCHNGNDNKLAEIWFGCWGSDGLCILCYTMNDRTHVDNDDDYDDENVNFVCKHSIQYDVCIYSK